MTDISGQTVYQIYLVMKEDEGEEEANKWLATLSQAERDAFEEYIKNSSGG